MSKINLLIITLVLIIACKGPRIVGNNHDRTTQTPTYTIDSTNYLINTNTEVLYFDSEQSSIDITVETNELWKAKSVNYWCSISCHPKHATITVEKNNTNSTRQTTVQLYNIYKIKQILIIQSPQTDPNNPDDDDNQDTNTPSKGYIVEKTLENAGQLALILSEEQLKYTSAIILHGPINKLDFTTLRVNMPNLQVLEINDTQTEYVGRINNKNNLKTTSLPLNATIIENEAFRNCSNLETVNLPNNLQIINMAAFENCSNLKNITFPKSLKIIENAAFAQCAKLEIVALNNAVNLYQIQDLTFQNCSAMTQISLPEKLTMIGFAAFQNCSELKHITLPESIKNIAAEAFAMCYSLQEIVCYATTPPTISTNTFREINPNTKLFVPKQCVELYKKSNGWSKFNGRTFALE